MSIFMRGAKHKLRFITSRGELPIENLFDLDLTELDSLAVEAETAWKNSKGKSFLEKKNKKDKTAKLKFDILLTVLNDKVTMEDRNSTALETKRHNAHIDELIAKKKEDDMSQMSVEELEALKR